MSTNPPIQGGWNVSALHEAWPTGPDNSYILGRLDAVPVDVTVRGARGPILEVGASEAVHCCRMSRMGFTTVALDPSIAMLGHARGRMSEFETTVGLVRGIAEKLPFANASFDRVLCESALDHFADPGQGIREMTRVLRPDGRLVIGVVNYGSLTVRSSRLVYRVGRRLGWLPRERHLFWDTPVPIEHTFECSYRRLVALCSQYLALDHAFGVSLGWAFPGWGFVLTHMHPKRSRIILRALDTLAYRLPQIADYVVTVWRPRPDAPVLD